MAITSNPYLNFPENNCREAMTFCGTIFGAEPSITALAGMGNVPDDDGLVMHAELRSDIITLMGADDCRGEGLQHGDTVTIGLMGEAGDLERCREIFDALAEGGEVSMPLETQEWGDTYGQLKDRYGFLWAINVASQHA